MSLYIKYMQHIKYIRILPFSIILMIFMSFSFNCIIFAQEDQSQKISPEISQEISQKPKTTKFELKIPKIGTFLLKGNLDIETEKYNFTGSLKELKPIIIGPLKIDPPKLLFSQELGLQIKGQASLFNKKAVFMLESILQRDGALFSIRLEKPISFPITPWKKLTFKKLYLQVSKTAQYLFTTTSLFSKTGEDDVEVNIGLEDLAGFAELSLKNLRLSSFLEPLKGSLLDEIVTKEVSIKISNFKNPTLTLNSVTDFSKITKKIKFPIVQDFSQMRTEIIISKKDGVKFEAAFAEDKPIVPFKGIPILQDIKLEDISLGLDIKKKALFVQGTTKIKNLSMIGRLELGSKIILTAKLDEDWKISDLEPQAKNTFLDDLKLPSGQLIISSKRFYDEEMGIQITKGINLVADFPLNDFILNFVKDEAKLKFLKSIPPFMLLPDKVKIYGSIGISLSDLSLQMIISKKEIPLLDIPNGPNIKGGNLAIFIEGDGPTVGGKLEIIVKPTPRDEALRFAATIDLNRLIINVAGSMAGRWYNPLGVASLLKLPKEKLAIEDCAIEVGYDLKRVLGVITTVIGGAGTVGAGAGTVATAGAAGGAAVGAGGATAVSAVATVTSNIVGLLPNRFGITGGIKVGDALAKLGILLSTDIDNIALMGKFVKEIKKKGQEEPEEAMIKLLDIVKFANDLGIKIPTNNIPNIGFMGDIRFAPKGARIGEISIDPGVTLKGQINIPNVFQFIDRKAPKTFNALVDMSISLEGIRMRGTMSRIKIPNFIEITGAGLDQIYGTDDDGPTLDAELSLKRQEFFFSGQLKFINEQLKLFKTESKTDGSFNSKGFKFNTETLLFNKKVKLKLNAQSIGKSLTQIKDFKVHGEFKDDFRDFIEKEIIKLVGNIGSELTNELTKARKKVATAEKEVNKLDIKISKKIRLIAFKMTGFNGNISNAQRRVDGINNELRRTQDARSKAKGFWKAGKRLYLTGKIAVLWASHKIAWGVLEAAKYIANEFMKNLNPEVVGLRLSKVAAIPPLRLAQFFLKGLEASTGLMAKAAQDIVKGVGGGFKIQKARIDFSVKEFLPPKSILPRITFDAVILGKKLKNQSIQYDLKRPDLFIRDLFKIVKNLLKP